MTLAFVAFHLYWRLFYREYQLTTLLAAFYRQSIAFGAMLTAGIGVVLLVGLLNMTMSWYAMPELVFPLYIVPMLTAAFWAHNWMAARIPRVINLKDLF